MILRPPARPAALAVAVATAVASAVLVAVRPRRVVVSGWSMSTTLLPDDRLLVAHHRHPRPGDLVAVLDPRCRDRLLVKRVAAVTAEGIEVRGDNPQGSTDSRTFGEVPAADVVGVVVRRYGPRVRAGRVR